jgi:hypothetical protein
VTFHPTEQIIGLFGLISVGFLHVTIPTESNKKSHATDTHREEQKYKIFTYKPKKKRLLGRERCRWEDNIKIDVKRMRGSDSSQGLLGGLK